MILDGKMAEATETDTLKFELKVKCSWNNKRTKEDTVADQMYHHYQSKPSVIVQCITSNYYSFQFAI